MDNLAKFPTEIKTNISPQDFIKKYRMELLAAPFSVSAYKLLLSLNLLLEEIETEAH